MVAKLSLGRARVRIGVAIVALATAAACGGQSCSCLSPIPGGFTPSKRVPNAVQARVGMQGINYLEQHANDLVNAFVPGGLNQPFGCTHASGADVCCPDGSGVDCQAQVTLT